MSLIHQLPNQSLCARAIFGYRSDGRSLEVYRYVSTQPQQKSEVGEPVRNDSSRAVNDSQPTLDEYLRKRLITVEGAISHLAGIEMYGNSVPAGTAGGDLFDYINFQQRYDVDARIQRAITLSEEFLEPLKGGKPARNSVDDHGNG